MNAYSVCDFLSFLFLLLVSTKGMDTGPDQLYSNYSFS
jgi:hypothetical protein